MAKTAFITGASSGIGEATSRLLLEQGWRVIATARSPEALGDWSRVPALTALALDVTNEEACELAVQQAIRKTGRIDALVNNAGAGLAGPLEAIAPSDFESLFETNLFGAVRLTRLLIPHFRANGGGVVVNISSIAGRFGLPLRSPYCATKFALEGFTESLYYELRPHGVRVKLIEPGGIQTRFKTQWHSAPGYEKVVERLRRAEETGLAKAPSPDLVARAVLRAALDDSRRLRYPVAARSFVLLHRLLPASAWQMLVQATTS